MFMRWSPDVLLRLALSSCHVFLVAGVPTFTLVAGVPTFTLLAGVPTFTQVGHHPWFPKPLIFVLGDTVLLCISGWPQLTRSCFSFCSAGIVVGFLFF